MRKLNTGKIAISLISLHYGLGFLLGTSEAVFNLGLAGMTYALSCALGLLFLSLISKFYWKKKYPLWTLLGNSFGKTVREGVCFLSWFWMIGIVASQVLGASFILGILGVPPMVGIIITITAVSLFSLIPIEKLSNIFFSLLIFNSLAIILGTVKITSINFLRNLFSSAPKGFSDRSIFSYLGIAVPTIFITLLGMDFHQFIVQAKTYKQAIIGSLLGGLGLIFIALLPTVITLSAVSHKILPANIDGKQVIPFVLLYEGRKFGFPFLGKVLVACLLTVSLASGSALTRILTRTFQDFDFISPKLRSRKIILVTNALTVFFLTLTGKTIISLIVCFYVIYLSGVIVPFLVYFVQSKKLFSFPRRAVSHSLVLGTVSSLVILVLSRVNFLPTILTENLEFFMMIFGIFSSVTALLVDLLVVRIIARLFSRTS